MSLRIVYNKPRFDKLYLPRILQSLLGLTKMEYTCSLNVLCMFKLKGDCEIVQRKRHHRNFAKKFLCDNIHLRKACRNFHKLPPNISLQFSQKKTFVSRIKAVTILQYNIMNIFVSKGFWHCLLRLDLNFN